MENTDFYKLIKKKDKRHNPHYDKHRMTVPFRALIIGGTGAGKTTSFLEIVKRMPDTFNLIIVCCKSSCEPLYDYLRGKVSRDNLIFYEGGTYPDIDDLKGSGQTLIVFDDLVLEKDQRKIAEFFIRGRKVGGGISCVYLTQSYFSTPRIIRQQCSYILFKNIQDKKDLKTILREWSMNISVDELLKLYKKAFKKKKIDFFMIDNESEDELYRFRRNFTPII